MALKGYVLCIFKALSKNETKIKKDKGRRISIHFRERRALYFYVWDVEAENSLRIWLIE